MISIIGATLKKIRDDAHDAGLSADGSQIVFKDSVTRDMLTMGADGGNPKLFLKKEDGVHRFAPLFFAAGKRIGYETAKTANGETALTLESRDLQGGSPTTLLANPRMTDFYWGQDGRLIFAASELPPNQYDSNLWELRFDPETGKPSGSPRRLTDWSGFYFINPALTADGKRFVFLNRKSQSDVYMAELSSDGNEMKSPQRFTLDDRLDWPGGWSPDSKTVFLYSDRNGSFDIYKQGVNDRNAEPIVSGPEEKWAPQISPDGKFILFMQWPKAVEGAPVASGKMMRVSLGGGPSEAVMDIKGRPGSPTSSDPLDTVGQYPSFRCPRTGTCVLAEADEKNLTFTAFDPVQGRKAELAKIPANADYTRWDLSPDASRIAISVFDYKVADIQIISLSAPLSGGAPQKFSALPFTELTSVAWSADGKSLYSTSYSSRGTTIIRLDLNGGVKPVFKSNWDIFSLAPSPDGHSMAFGPIIYNANAWTIGSFPAK